MTDTAAVAHGPLAGGTVNEAAISVVGVTKRFHSIRSEKTLKERLIFWSEAREGFTALRDVSFDVRRGETFGVLGHNGSGKSTMLKLISGIMRPTEGVVQVDGRLAALLELGAGFHPDLSGRENVYLNGSILGLDRQFVADRYDEIVEFSELGDFMEMQVRHYSSGMRARLGFSVATQLQPDVLLVDEVLAVGDERFQEKCMARVHEFRSSGRTMMIVSHSPARISELCDRAMVLDEGLLLHVGEPSDAAEVYRKALAERGERVERRAVDRRMHDAKPEARSGSADQKDNAGPPARLLDAGIVVNDDGEAGQDRRNDRRRPSLSQPGQVQAVSVPVGSSMSCWADIEAVKSVEVVVRVLIRVPGGLALVNRTSTSAGGEPLSLEPGRVRVWFDFGDVPLQDGRFNVALLVESPDGKTKYGHRMPLGVLSIQEGIRGCGPLRVDLAQSVVRLDDDPDRVDPPMESAGAVVSSYARKAASS